MTCSIYNDAVVVAFDETSWRLKELIHDFTAQSKRAFALQSAYIQGDNSLQEATLEAAAQRERLRSALEATREEFVRLDTLLFNGLGSVASAPSQTGSERPVAPGLHTA